MAWDIYGNNLRSGYCEVHPHIQQEYPCDMCCRDIKENDNRNREHQKSKAEYYNSLELSQTETVRVVIDELIKKIPLKDLNSDSLDIDFNGHYLIQIQKESDVWKVTNAMNGHGYNCFDEFKDYKVEILK